MLTPGAEAIPGSFPGEPVGEDEEPRKAGWEDVEPVEQDEGDNPVCKILYSKEFKQLMDIFRAVIRSGEKSRRVIELTKEILDQNAANYTVWQWRRECLRASFRPTQQQDNDVNSSNSHDGSNGTSTSNSNGNGTNGIHNGDESFSGGTEVLFDELDFMDSFARDNPKNYQIWYHRRAVVEMMMTAQGGVADGDRELAFCAEVFEVDAKNYHAWAHRQWVISTFNLWSSEISYVETLLTRDVRNNSAWNQRWFVVHNGPQGIDAATLQREIKFTISSILKVKDNESAWNYLRGLARHHRGDVANRIQKWCIETLPTQPKNPFIVCLLADLLEEEGSLQSLQSSLALLQDLVQLDPLRAKAWNRRIQLVGSKISTYSA